MAYWLYNTNSQNWEVTKRTNTLGVAERYRNAISRINIGDKILIYVKSSKLDDGTFSQPAIVGEYEATSNVFQDEKKLFYTIKLAPHELFKLRMRLKPVKMPKNPVEFKPLVPKLDFIKNKEYWSLTLRGAAILSLPETDYTFISSKF